MATQILATRRLAAQTSAQTSADADADARRRPPVDVISAPVVSAPLVSAPLASAPAVAPSPLRIEHLPKALLCVPLVLHWMLLAARYRSLTLPSCLNPRIEMGGLAGESKSACLAQIGSAFAPWVAPWRRVVAGEDAAAARMAAGLDYPIIAKPDIGWCGYGVRRVDDDAALARYAAAVPPGGAYILQRLVAAPNEAGLLYIRTPGARHGRVAALTLRHTPGVMGDGERSVATLVDADPRCRPHAADYAAALGEEAFQRILPQGERVALTTIASLRMGARYQDASARITPALTARIDAIARSMGDFHYGRFDVRFPSLAALLEGEFSIIEVNGAGSEAIQFWDPALPLAAAFRGVFAKQSELFALGHAMRRTGHRPAGPVALSRAWLRQQRLLRRYPASN